MVCIQGRALWARVLWDRQLMRILWLLVLPGCSNEWGSTFKWLGLAAPGAPRQPAFMCSDGPDSDTLEEPPPPAVRFQIHCLYLS